jgi:hypothetical protein
VNKSCVKLDNCWRKRLTGRKNLFSVEMWDPFGTRRHGPFGPVG